MSKSKIYEFQFKSLWLGGKAIVKAISQESAHKALKKTWPNLPDLNKCRVKEIPDRDGVLYFDSGDY